MANKAGFTLIEVVLSLGIISILLGITITAYQPLYVRNELDVAANTLIQDIYRAQALSRHAERDDQWGVSIQNNMITLFRGATYATRMVSFDENYSLPSVITPSGTSEYDFAKLTGLPAAAGDTTLTSSNNETRSINVNSKGLVEH